MAMSPLPSTEVVLSSVGPANPLPKSTQYFFAASPFTIGSPGGSSVASLVYSAAMASPFPSVAALDHSVSTWRICRLVLIRHRGGRRRSGAGLRHSGFPAARLACGAEDQERRKTGA